MGNVYIPYVLYWCKSSCRSYPIAEWPICIIKCYNLAPPTIDTIPNGTGLEARAFLTHSSLFRKYSN